MKVSTIIIILFCLVHFSPVFGQSKLFKDKMNQGNAFLSTLDFKRALKNYLSADSMDATHAETKYDIGVCYLKSDVKEKALGYFEKVLELAPTQFSDIHYLIGNCLQFNSEWDKASTEYIKYQSYLLLQKDTKEKRFAYSEVMKRIEECNNGKEVCKAPIRVFIDNLGSIVNTAYVDYTPVISADEDMLMFTSRRPTTTGGAIDPNCDEYFEDIYRTYNFDGQWDTPTNLGPPINTIGHDATVNLSPDGQKLLVYIDNKGEGNIWESQLSGENWTAPIKLPSSINSKYHESSASYSYDGNTLYFVSYRPGGIGGGDIYYVIKDKKGNWGSEAYNIGAPINTIYDEESVFMMPDGKTMYFSSKGHKTMGGFDIFKTTLDSLGRWSEPENIGSPINGADDDLTFVIAASGKHAYYSSVKKQGYGSRDIYMISFLGQEKNPSLSVEDNLIACLTAPISETSSLVSANVEIKTSALTVLKGIILDAVTKTPLAATITLTDNATGKELANFKSNSKTGKYLVTLPAGKNYGIAVKNDGYLFHSENFEIPASSSYQEIVIDIPLKNVSVGSRIVLKNVFYDFNKATLRNESQTELNLLIKLLNDVPTMRIELSSHTDNKGTEKYNLDLSERRSTAVVEYLVTHGIDAKRLESKGYGFSDPLAPNDTEAGRQMNRRTEFKILSR